MTHRIRMALLFTCMLLLPGGAALADPTQAIPVKGMVTMVDLGANKCVPCKMMAPILEKLQKTYEGRAAIIFLDVWEDHSLAQRYGIRSIPTQIFYDRDGREAFRHVGFMDEKRIVYVLEKLGVPGPDNPS